MTQLTSEQVHKFAQSGELSLESLGGLKLLSDDVEVIRTEKEGVAVETDGPVAVALDTTLTEDLLDEGFAREVVNKIQNMRKTSGFEVTDRIVVRYNSGDRLKRAVDRFDEFIRRETLAREIEFAEHDQLTDTTEWNINGEKAALAVAKA